MGHLAIAAAKAYTGELLERAGGVRDPDDRRWHGTDHDLLVRIDERLLGLKGSVDGLMVKLLSLEARVDTIETWRSVVEGAQRANDRVNARVASVLVVGASAFTALLVKVIEKLWL